MYAHGLQCTIAVTATSGQVDGMVLRVSAVVGTTQPCLTRTNAPPSNHGAGSGALSDLRNAETMQLSSCTACLHRTGSVHTVPFLSVPPLLLRSASHPEAFHPGAMPRRRSSHFSPGDGGLDPGSPDKGGRLRQELFFCLVLGGS